MKKWIVTFALMLLAWGASAQIADTTYVSMLKRTGARMKLDGVRLSKVEQQQLLSDIGGVDYNDAWNKARGWRTAGISMMAAGSAVALFGAGYTMVYSLAGLFGIVIGAGTAAVVTGAVGGDSDAAAQGAADNVSAEIGPHITGGLITTFVGAGTAIAGIPITVVNCRKMSKIVDEYNNIHNPAPAAELTFGPTRNGVGLALNF